MGFLDSLNIIEYFERRKFAKLDQRATEAVLDAIVFAMLSDNEVDQLEVDQVLDFGGRLTWQGDASLGAYVNDLISDADGKDMATILPGVCEDIAARVVGFDWLPEEVYYLAAKVVGADDVHQEEERVFLGQLSRAMQLDSETQRLVIQRIRTEEL